MEGCNPYSRTQVEQYLRNGAWLGLTVSDLFDRAVAATPEKEALVAEGVRLTYTALSDRVNRLALAFLELGIKPGERVLVQLPNQAEFAETYLALQRIGAVTVMSIPRHALKEVEFFLRQTAAVAWVVPAKYRKTDYAEMIATVRSRFPALKVVVLGGPVPAGAFSFEKMVAGAQPEKYPPGYLAKFRPHPDDVTHLMPTGGTTGLPKLVPRTHNSYICDCRYYADAMELRPDFVDMIILPLGHNAGLLQFVSAILMGRTIVLSPSTRPEDILRYIARERVTWISSVPTVLGDLLRYPGPERRALASLKFIGCGAAHCPVELVREVLDGVGCKFVNGFGMSEGPMARSRLGDSRETIIGTVGTPNCPHDEFKIVDEAEASVPQGGEGELACRGPGVFTGYYQAEEANRRAFTRDGFFRTGDLAKFDAEGHIVVTGRKKDLINRGGEKISATEVEELIATYPDVMEAAAVGMPDSRLGEKVCAYIRPVAGKTIGLEGLVIFLKQQGASVLLLPERLELVSEMPLTPVGKIDKKVLLADITRKLGDEGKRGQDATG